MLGRIYTISFIALMAFLLWYQRNYLQKAGHNFQAQLGLANSVLPVAILTNFYSKDYKQDMLFSILAGDTLTYFSDGHFEASGHIVYRELSPAGIVVRTLSTDKAFGTFSSPNSNQALEKSKLNSVYFPNKVDFSIDGNKGESSQVHIDVPNQTIYSTQKLVSSGPQGGFEGVGFFYSHKDGRFKLDSQVQGEVILPQQKSKKP